MSNHHLRNKELTLKAKGLLSQMLSLPDAIRTAIWELEQAGYIARQQGRDDKGKMTAIEYTIFEQPQPADNTPPPLEYPILENPTTDKPTLDKPTLENPTSDKPLSENPTQFNKEILKTDLPKTNLSITDLSSTQSIPFPKSRRGHRRLRKRSRGKEQKGSVHTKCSRNLQGHYQGQYRVRPPHHGQNH